MTLNSLILGFDVNFLDGAPHKSASETVKKRHKHIKQCKEALQERWTHEYLVPFKEKHNLKHKDKTIKINVGDVVMIRGEEKNRGHWKIVNPSVYWLRRWHHSSCSIRTRKKLIDRPIQLLYPLEPYCEDMTTTNEEEKN